MQSTRNFLTDAVPPATLFDRPFGPPIGRVHRVRDDRAVARVPGSLKRRALRFEGFGEIVIVAEKAVGEE